LGTDDPTIRTLRSEGLQGLVNSQGAFGFGRIRMMHTSMVILHLSETAFLRILLLNPKIIEDKNVE
jgi:cytochrome c oxidase cbb3-type subunit I/II